ncbi:uncharacterized protein LOC122257905 [Penaeus japonicus]|uniref:uncharacterized protein LOC122257905 n=1 Tax=Penaeus japonicus TaxID=27405 RepID=UPI001C70BA4A|nr:uncharacterized protein LOC122257905 [Penaeus japonicus]
MDCMAREMQREAPWDVLFAEEVVVDAETREEEEERVEWWREALEDRGTRVSREETEYLRVATGAEGRVRGGNVQGGRVRGGEELMSLGSTVREADAGSEKEVAKGISNKMRSVEEDHRTDA